MKTVKEILEESGLDFTINKVPMYAVTDTTTFEAEETPYFALQNSKTGEFINSVKGSYTVSQNEEIVTKVMEGIKPFGTQLDIQKAGSLNGGRKVFMQLAIEGQSKVAEDIIKKYITIIDSNDGSTGLSIGIGDLTMSCQNQFFAFYRSGQFKSKHTQSIEQTIKMLPMAIKEALSQSMEMIELYNKLASTPMTKGLADKMVKHLVGTDRLVSEEELTDLSTRKRNMMETLYAHIQKETAQKGNNLWGLHSGVTSWTTHEKSAPKRENGRLESIMIGTNYRTNHDSLNFVKALL